MIKDKVVLPSHPSLYSMDIAMTSLNRKDGGDWFFQKFVIWCRSRSLLGHLQHAIYGAPQPEVCAHRDSHEPKVENMTKSRHGFDCSEPGACAVCLQGFPGRFDPRLARAQTGATTPHENGFSRVEDPRTGSPPSPTRRRKHRWEPEKKCRVCCGTGLHDV